MCVKLPLGDLNPDPFSSTPHKYPTSIYTCRVTTALRVRGGLLGLESTQKYKWLVTEKIGIKYSKIIIETNILNGFLSLIFSFFFFLF